jgi:hypothetical protein
MLAKSSRERFRSAYSGGANAMTVLDLFETGIRPITLATDMLKPGGYVRLRQMAQILEQEGRPGAGQGSMSSGSGRWPKGPSVGGLGPQGIPWHRRGESSRRLP